MRILMVLNHKRDLDSGAAGALQFVGMAMREIGHHVDFIFADNIEPPLVSINSNLSAIVDAPIFIVKRIRDLESGGAHYDVVQISSAEGYLYGFFNRVFHRKPVYVYQSHGLENRYWQDYFKIEEALGKQRVSEKFNIWFRHVRLNQERLAVKAADAIFVPCRQDREFLVNNLRVNPAKVFAIPRGVSGEFFVKNHKQDRDKDLIFVGWWGKRKGIEYLAKGFNAVCRRRPGTRLTVVGSRVDNSDVYALFPSHIRENIEVYRCMRHFDLIREYRRHKIMIFPTLFEGFPRVVLEGMASELVVVATAEGGTRDIVRDRESGILVPPRSDSMLAAEVVHLLENGEIRQEIGKRAAKVARNYTWDTVARNTVEILEGLVTRRARLMGARV